jgi:hypothetical protein
MNKRRSARAPTRGNAGKIVESAIFIGVVLFANLAALRSKFSGRPDANFAGKTANPSGASDRTTAASIRLNLGEREGLPKEVNASKLAASARKASPADISQLSPIFSEDALLEQLVEGILSGDEQQEESEQSPTHYADVEAREFNPGDDDTDADYPGFAGLEALIGVSIRMDEDSGGNLANGGARGDRTQGGSGSGLKFGQLWRLHQKFHEWIRNLFRHGHSKHHHKPNPLPVVSP